MFVNRTLEYKKLLRGRNIGFSPLLTTSIRVSLSNIQKSVLTFGAKQEKHHLPSFTPRKKRQEDIEDIKKDVCSKISCAEKVIGEIYTLPVPKALATAMHDHFIGCLKTTIYNYRGMQQEFLKKIDFYEDFEQQRNKEGDEVVMLESLKDVKKSIYDLTTILLDMKMAIGQQSSQIDRLDFYFDSINVYLEETNKELETIPISNTGIKNKVMYTLICFSLVLILLSVLKLTKD